jgi:hypothetical protein
MTRRYLVKAKLTTLDSGAVNAPTIITEDDKRRAIVSANKLARTRADHWSFRDNKLMRRVWVYIEQSDRRDEWGSRLWQRPSLIYQVHVDNHGKLIREEW